VFRSGGARLENLREYPGLDNEHCLHPYLKISPMNIRDALYEGGTEATKTYYRVNQAEELTMWM